MLHREFKYSESDSSEYGQTNIHWLAFLFRNFTIRFRSVNNFIIYSILMGSNSYFLSCVGYFRTVYNKKESNMLHWTTVGSNQSRLTLHLPRYDMCTQTSTNVIYEPFLNWSLLCGRLTLSQKILRFHFRLVCVFLSFHPCARQNVTSGCTRCQGWNVSVCRFAWVILQVLLLKQLLPKITSFRK